MKIQKPFERMFFCVLSITLAVLLSLRPIPGLDSPNDTGRYIYEFDAQCRMSLSSVLDFNISWFAFHTISRPLCGFSQQRLFMFFAALPIPLAFLLFGGVGRRWLLWSVGALLTVPAFEFATNALRQGVSLFFLLGCVRELTKGNKPLGLVLGGCSTLLHVAAIAYVPFLFFLATTEFRARHARLGMLAFLALLAAMVGLAVLDPLAVVSDFFEARQAWYEEGSSPAFIAFIVFPLVYTYCVRIKFSLGAVPYPENQMFIYSLLLLAGTLLFFPAIAYRLALSSAVLQIFLATASPTANAREGRFVIAGLASHLAFFVTLSQNARGVLFG